MLAFNRVEISRRRDMLNVLIITAAAILRHFHVENITNVQHVSTVAVGNCDRGTRTNLHLRQIQHPFNPRGSSVVFDADGSSELIGEGLCMRSSVDPISKTLMVLAIVKVVDTLINARSCCRFHGRC